MSQEVKKVESKDVSMPGQELVGLEPFSEFPCPDGGLRVGGGWV